MKEQELRVLNVEDSPEDGELILRELKKGGLNVDYRRVMTGEEMNEALKDGGLDVIIADYALPGFSGPEALELYKESGLDIPFILVSGHIGDEAAVEVMKAGAHDYVLKNNLTRLVPSIQRELRETVSRRERRKAQEELMRMSLAVRMSSDGISVHDMDGHVVDMNRAFLELAGYSSRERLLGTPFLDLLPSGERRRGQAGLEELVSGGDLRNREFELQRDGGDKISVELSGSLMSNGTGEPMGFVAITRDISQRKKAEWQMKRSLMKYDLREGTVYLVKETSPGKSKEGFRDLLQVGYTGVVLTRTPPDNGGGNGRYETLWLSENGGDGSIEPSPSNIIRWLKESPRKMAILIDRIDYLFSRHGVRDTISLVQYLRELTYLNDHVIIISLDPATLGEMELRQLEKETSEMDVMESAVLPDGLLRVIKTVYEGNLRGEKPSYTQLCTALDISKPTVRKRVRDLIYKGFAVESARGRTKVVEVTDKGRRLFSSS